MITCSKFKQKVSTWKDKTHYQHEITIHQSHSFFCQLQIKINTNRYKKESMLRAFKICWYRNLKKKKPGDIIYQRTAEIIP